MTRLRSTGGASRSALSVAQPAGTRLAMAALLLGAASAAAADATTPPRRIGAFRTGLAGDSGDWPERPEPPAESRPVLTAPPWRHGLAEPTDLASSFQPTKRFDLRISIGYQHREVRGQLKREVNAAVPDQATSLVFRDLSFARTRDELVVRAELGVFRDLMFHVELPIVLGDHADLSFDRSASPCTLPPTPGATCIASENSSTVSDGIAPASGYDATAGGAALNDPTVFRGVRRGASGGSGADALDTLNFALTWAPMSQRQDPTKPTWVIAIEPRLSIGTIRAFDRMAPDANKGVSDGVHRIHFRTAVSRRVGRFEPYFSLFYALPIARSGSAFVDYGSSQKTKDPQHHAGGFFGTEIIAYEKGRPDWRVAIDLRGRLEGHFAGLGYSDAWEMFASSPALRCDAVANPACDSTATQNPYQSKPFTGVTSIAGYATVGVEVAIDAILTRWLHLRAGFAYARDQSHLITGDDVGKPSIEGGRVSQPAEFNPAYRPVIDQAGRRYLVDNVDTFDARVTAQARF